MIEPVFWAVSLPVVFVVGVSKSGLVGSLGMVAVPLLALVMPAREAAGVMLPVLIVLDLVAVWTYRRDADWRVLIHMLPGAALGTALGWLAWRSVSDAQVLLAVGLITIIFMLDALLPLRKRLPNLPPSPTWGAFWGATAGLTSFISHTGGPPFQIYTLPLSLAPVTLSATTAYFFASVNLMKLGPYYLLGQLSPANLALSGALAPVGLCGLAAGVYLVRRVSAKVFYGLAYTLILLLGLKLTYDGIRGVFFA